MIDALDILQGHRSTFNVRHTDTNRPGRHRRVAKTLRTVQTFDLSAVFLQQTSFNLQYLRFSNSVEMAGFEPATFALQRRCSPAELHPQEKAWLVGLTGFEPVTPALSAQCSNQLSYKPGGTPQQLNSDRKHHFANQLAHSPCGHRASSP